MASETQQRTWRLWFPARLGPKRTRERKIAGQKVKMKVRTPELPPTKNGSRGNPFAHAKWVKEWRDAARDEAKAAQIPPLKRVRVSGIVYRKALGVADAMNDLDRLHPLVDGLQDAGVIAKDTRRHLEHGTCTEQRAGQDGPGVLLVVEALEV